MKKNRTDRSTTAFLFAVVLGVLAPAVARAEFGVGALVSPASRGAYTVGVIEDGPSPITQIALRIAYHFGVIEDGPDPINTRRKKLAIIDGGPDPITQSRPR